MCVLNSTTISEMAQWHFTEASGVAEERRREGVFWVAVKELKICYQNIDIW